MFLGLCLCSLVSLSASPGSSDTENENIDLANASTCCYQVLEILQSADATNLYSPEVEREKRKQTNAVTTDLLGALLAVSVVVYEVLSAVRREEERRKGDRGGDFLWE